MANTRSTRRSSSTDHAPRDHYAAVTDQVIAALEAGTPPWRKPWDPEKAGGPSMPRNAATGARYRGINVLALGMSPLAFCSGDPRWATYRQSGQRGWQVRKGEKSTTGYFFKRIEVRDAADAGGGEDATRRIPLLRAFALFHASQIEGIGNYVPPTIEEAPWRAPEATETIVANSGAVVRTGGDQAFYSPTTDHIQMPPMQAFHSASAWTCTILHELGHWSGAKTRLDRDLHNRFGSHDYSREELRADLASCFAGAALALPCDIENHASYLQSWIDVLKADKRAVFKAAAAAQKAADWMLALHPDYADALPGEDSDSEAGGHDAAQAVTARAA